MNCLQKTHKHHIKSMLHNKMYFNVFIVYYIYDFFLPDPVEEKCSVFKKKKKNVLEGSRELSLVCSHPFNPSSTLTTISP